MIRALLALLFYRLFVVLSRRAPRASAAPPVSSLPAPRGQRLETETCACLVREVLGDRQIGCFEIEHKYGIPERRLLAIRAGRAIPSVDEKLAILQALNTARPKSRKPKLRYEDLWGEDARPRNCTCDLRRFLDSHELTAEHVARELGIEKKIVLRWRSGAAKPTPAQWSHIRDLAREHRGTLEFTSHDLEQRWLA